MSKNKNSAFLFEFTFRENTPQADYSKESIKKKIIYDLDKMGVAKKKDFIDFKLKSEKYGYVIYDYYHRHNTDLVLNYLKSNNIESCGRFSEFEYLNTDHVIERAMKLVSSLNKKWKI